MTDLTPTARDLRRQRAAELGGAMRQAVLATVETNAATEDLAAATLLARQLTQLLGQRRRASNEIPAIDDLSVGIRTYGLAGGPGSPLAPPAHFETTATGARGTVTLDRRFEGAPGHVHGGVISMLLDEAFGQAVTRAGRWGLTAYLNVTYLRAIPLNTPLELHATLERSGGRKVNVEGGIRSGTDETIQYATGTALFVEPRSERHAEYFGNIVDSNGAAASVRLGGESGW